MTQLHAGRFVLRPFTPADAPAFAEAVRESMASVGRWMSWAHAAYSRDEALSWIAFCDAARAAGHAHEFGIFLDDGETLVGGAGLNQFNTVNAFCNLGYWVRASKQRQGAALAAVDVLTRYAFDALQLSRVEIVIAEDNLPSLEVARKAGAKHECLARNRLQLRGRPVDAHVLSLVPALM
jgi:RimJ/RimL family protein N-acetyltransferase